METLRSSVKSSLMRFALLRGTILAGLGAAVLIYGTFLPVKTLSVWGFPLFCLSLGMIAVGLLPYRKLRRLEMNPYEILIEDDQWWHFVAKGVCLFSIPINSVEKTEYLDEANQYGIKVFLKKPIKEQIKVHARDFDMGGFIATSRKRQKCDLFLPYFSARAYNSLKKPVIAPLIRG